jgi:hypothetical protein
VLEPYAGKVASTVLRRECHCEVMFLSDKIGSLEKSVFENLEKAFVEFFKLTSP